MNDPLDESIKKEGRKPNSKKEEQKKDFERLFIKEDIYYLHCSTHVNVLIFIQTRQNSSIEKKRKETKQNKTNKLQEGLARI